MKLFSKLSVLNDEDEGLMDRLKAGDRKAFEILYERYKGSVMSFVRAQIKDRGVTEDLVQEVFMKIYRARETYESGRPFRPWLWMIVRNAVIDHVREPKELLFQDSEGSDSGPSIEALEDPLPNAEQQLFDKVDRDRIDRCLDELTGRAKEAVLLRTLSEMNYEEIAGALQLGVGAIKSILFRAKDALMECFKRGSPA